MVFTPKKYFFLVLKATDAQYAEQRLLSFFSKILREISEYSKSGQLGYTDLVQIGSIYRLK